MRVSETSAIPFDHLLFFADAGNGDQFAFPIVADGVVRQDIYYVEPRRRQPHVGRSLADDFPGKVAARSTLGVGVVVRVRLAERL